MKKDNSNSADVYEKIHPITWPLRDRGEPALMPGSDKLDKPFIMRLKENFWNSIDTHCKRLGISKSQWVAEAMKNQLDYEQQHFLAKSKSRE